MKSACALKPTLKAPHADDEVVGLEGGTLAVGVVGDLLLERGEPLGGTILQCSSGPLGQRVRGSCPEPIDIEQGGVGKSAGKADHPGLAEQLEQFTDGRGLAVEQTVGKLHGNSCGHGEQAHPQQPCHNRLSGKGAL